MDTTLPKYGPKVATHPSIGKPCPACNKKFKEGDYTTLVVLGPGNSKEQQRRVLKGQPYNAVALEVHWTCATGQTAGLNKAHPQ